MTLDEFKLVDPGSEFIMLYYTGSSPAHITALNMSAVDCEGNNLSRVLQTLSQVTVPLNGGTYTFNVVGRAIYSRYGHFTIEDQAIETSSFITEGVCSTTFTNPTIQDTLFLKSDYQAIQNNASNNRSVGFIFDVDRKKLQISASNIDAINAGTATLADFQELNYSSVGITNSRYGGSKTTAEEYGISPAFGGLVVDAAIYATSQTTGSICAQSINDRTIEEIVVGYDAATSPSFDGSAQYTDTISINYSNLAKFYFTSGSDILPGATTLTLNAYVDVYEDDIIRLKQGTLLEEVMKVTSVTSKSASETIFSVTRAYKSDVDPNNAATTFYRNGTLGVSRLTGTQVFKADGNKLYRLSNKKVWIKENSKVFYVDEGGQVIFELVTCSV